MWRLSPIIACALALLPVSASSLVPDVNDDGDEGRGAPDTQIISTSSGWQELVMRSRDICQGY